MQPGKKLSSLDGATAAEPTQPEDQTEQTALAEREASLEERLHAQLFPTVNRLLWTFLGPDPERDDIAQEIFIRIFRGAARVREPARLEPWAVRIAMNCIKNEFRRRTLRRLLSLDATRDAEHPRFHQDFEGRELLRRTYALLEKLPPQERIPLTLQLLENADLEHIAEICACSARTAKRRLKSARERFERLARQDPLLASRFA